MSDSQSPPVARMAAFVVMASAIWLSLHIYAAWRIAAGLGIGGAAWLWILAILLTLGDVGALAASWGKQDARSVGLRRMAYLYMGAFSVIWTSLAAAHLLAALWSLLSPPPDWLGPFLVVISLAAALFVTLVGARNARKPVPLVEIEIPIPGLHRDLEGYRIVQLCDVHVGAPTTKAGLDALVATANAVGGDLIAFVGDLVDGSVRQLADHVEAVAALRARDGVYFVTGNHEYYSGAKAWERHLSKLGLTVLVNEHRRVTVGAATLQLAGVTDIGAGQFIPADTSDPARAVGDVDGADCVVLLAHNPRSMQAARGLRIDLQLSGHTHGGQYPPWSWLVHLVHRPARGLHRIDRTWLYVSCGSGLWGPPIRLGAPAEVTAITLRSENIT